ncbi:hypothetical protein RHGRI_012296 [Rhododendron griersonianum]|uniref:Peptidase A2 domain-containing protein n=3 Tax=Rhododendron griersonianum TaxID=479676 RepID=A0AAV6KRK8_9ERIC|nr:hypothetical protein RHGRI_012296 [Rhododendron griersonianum]
MEVIQDMYGPGLLRASQFEAILQEEEQLKSTSLGTYYQDVEGDIEIDVAQIIGKNPIVCDTLIKTEKPMNMPSSQPNRRGGQANYRQYSFDLAQANPIFDELLKQKFITLSTGHILPSDKERKGKEYCKWHNSFRHNTNNCVTFRNCVQDLIQKGLLQYAKCDKEPMGIDANPFPKVEVNMVTASLSKRLGSTVEKKKREDENQMETDDELAKSHFSRFPNDYLCIRCGHEVEYGEAIMLEKEQKNAFSKSGIRFNTMGGNDLQIYVGAKLIYKGIDPGLFNRIESEHCYGPDDGPFLFRGNPVVPARPGVPSHQDLEAVGYQFPSRGRYPNHRGVGPRRGMGPRGRGPYGYGGHQPRMVMPPNQGHEEWSTLSHPKFPAEGWYTKVSTSQKRRLQRKFAARAYGDPWDHVFEPRGRVEPAKVPNMVWTREQGESSIPKQAVPNLGGQDSNHEASSKSNAQPKGKKELRQSLKKKMEEFQKLIEADDDDLLGEGSEQEDLIKDTTPSPQQSPTFGESLAAIQFGSVPINFQCNMILVLPKHFRAKPDQPMELAGDVEDNTQSTVKIADEEEHSHSQLIKIETDKRGDKVVVLRSPDDASTRHLKPLYVKVHMNGQPISKVLVDNGAVVNILPSRMMKLLNKTSNDLILTEVTVGNFAGGCSPAKGVISLQLQLGTRKMNTTFFVVDSSSNYNALLGRYWIHINGCVPSSLHQALIFLKHGEAAGMEVFWADQHPFQAETNNVEADLYKEYLWPMKIEDSEVKSTGVGVTESQFLTYVKEGLQELSKEFVRPNVISRPTEEKPQVFNV